MATPRDLQPHQQNDRAERVIENRGYVLAPGQSIHDVLALEAELLASEGIDPAWPPLDKPAHKTS